MNRITLNQKQILIYTLTFLLILSSLIASTLFIKTKSTYSPKAEQLIPAKFIFIDPNTIFYYTEKNSITTVNSIGNIKRYENSDTDGILEKGSLSLQDIENHIITDIKRENEDLLCILTNKKLYAIEINSSQVNIVDKSTEDANIITSCNKDTIEISYQSEGLHLNEPLDTEEQEPIALTCTENKAITEINFTCYSEDFKFTSPIEKIERLACSEDLCIFTGDIGTYIISQKEEVT